jgi:hypothetical protein
MNTTVLKIFAICLPLWDDGCLAMAAYLDVSDFGSNHFLDELLDPREIEIFSLIRRSQRNMCTADCKMSHRTKPRRHGPSSVTHAGEDVRLAMPAGAAAPLYSCWGAIAAVVAINPLH